ncbi:hypothetical protein Psfp_00084 [Pelotomaculum sp. FP]|uniref:hypothetical protein n=1 Tax=Pelotomaculum sp. FP TaxID=261474 RepID=UPI00106559AF|nr:hypothetical protein [Pelotomaculum sp. FP]TEB17961.1 hypothetical protein Psfp_00084 [Pelotomaculum sp. FP]
MVPEGRKYNTFNQGSDARLSVVAAVILSSTGTNTPSRTPRINDPVRIEIKQCHRFVPVTTVAKSVEDTASIIVWTPNGRGNPRAKIDTTPTARDNNNAFEQLTGRLKSRNPILMMRNVCGIESSRTIYQGNGVGCDAPALL